jgi:membrane-bound serine protease (ClpP class)
MAPATNIGAAAPVQMGGLPFAPNPWPAEDPTGKDAKENKQSRPSTAEEKVVNDTVAWVRSLAQLRGRNADWAERAVRESIAAPASEAVEQRIVDFIATDFADLLQRLEGRQIPLQDRSTVTLRLQGAQVETFEMWWGERLLTSLANPTVAFLLMIFGFYGVLLELYTPGWGVSGTVGALCLVLAFLGFAVLPINYVGLALLAAGLVLLVAEAFVTSYGALALAGTLCLIFGGLMLVESPEGFLRVSAWVVIPVGIATATITVFLVSRILATHRLAPISGIEGLLGTEAIASEEFHKEGAHFAGFVRAHGELWKAQSPDPVSAGQQLAISGQHGLTLQVRNPAATAETETERGDS